MVPENGYQEFAHTADWGIHVWAGNVISLLYTAAEGMFTLLEVTTDPQYVISARIEISATSSREALLVDFLNELLFLLERDGSVFGQFKLALKEGVLTGRMAGKKVLTQRKEIKAATFHGLVVEETERGLEARIVFDV